MNAWCLVVGSYTDAGNPGLHTFRGQGDDYVASTSRATDNPSWLITDAQTRRLYCVNEGALGHLSAFELSDDGDLRPLARVPTQGAGPCHVALDPEGRWAFVSHYDGGTLSVMPLDAEGMPGPPLQIVDFRSENEPNDSHIHCAIPSTDGQYLLVVDLGHDCIHSYRIDPAATQPLVSIDRLSVSTGMGPRHLRLSQDGKRAWLVGEHDGSLLALHHDSGRLSVQQRVDLDRSGQSRKQGGAEISLSNDERFLYASNRGDVDEITVWAIDATGSLRWLQSISSQGRHPRHFTLTPDGRHLLVANQHSDEVVIFPRDRTSGTLAEYSRQLPLKAPACLRFVDESTMRRTRP